MTAGEAAAIVTAAAGAAAGVVGYVRGVRSDRIAGQVATDTLRLDSLNRLVDQLQEDNTQLRAEIVAVRHDLAECKRDCEIRIAALQDMLRGRGMP